MIGLDTSAIIDLFKGKQEIRELVAKIKEPLASTQINYLELQFGINPEEKTHQKEHQYYNKLFRKLIHLNLNTISSVKASEIKWKLKKRGEHIGTFDCTIAGIFLTNGVQRVITKNEKHFSKVPGIKVISY